MQAPEAPTYLERIVSDKGIDPTRAIIEEALLLECQVINGKVG